ncbi:MAG: hypothetical protein J6A37_05470 [Oscillospiraceae bacterium]|nr:hypothetical protein [Oscillospiraceae bacterium]
MKDCYFYCSYNYSDVGFELAKASYNNGTLSQVETSDTPVWISNNLSENPAIIEFFRADDSEDSAVLIRNMQLLVPNRKADKYISALFIGGTGECRRLVSYIITKPMCFANKMHSVIIPIPSFERKNAAKSYKIDCQKLNEFIIDFTDTETYQESEKCMKNKYSTIAKRMFKFDDLDEFISEKAFVLTDSSVELKEKMNSLFNKCGRFLKRDLIKKEPIYMDLSDVLSKIDTNKNKCDKCKYLNT